MDWTTNKLLASDSGALAPTGVQYSKHNALSTLDDYEPSALYGASTYGV